jgi:hypothetical protein
MDALDGGHWRYGDNSIPEVGVTFFAGTYVRHPLTMAAAHAMLSHLKREGPELQRELSERMAAVARELNQFLIERQVPAHLEHFSSFFWVRFDSKIKHASLLFFHLREKGIHIFEGRLFFLSTAHSEADVALLVRAFKESIVEMQAAGFLPETPGESAPPAVAEIAPPVPAIRAEPESPSVSRRETPVIQPVNGDRALPITAAPRREIKFSVYFFGNYPAVYRPDKYNLLIERASRIETDSPQSGLQGHFHPVGGFSP